MCVNQPFGSQGMCSHICVRFHSLPLLSNQRWVLQYQQRACSNDAMTNDFISFVLQKEELMEPVEARERALSRLGAVWRPPLLLEVRGYQIDRSTHRVSRAEAANSVDAAGLDHQLYDEERSCCCRC